MKKVKIDFDSVELHLHEWLEAEDSALGLRFYAEDLRKKACDVDNLAFILTKYKDVELTMVGDELVASGDEEALDLIVEEGLGTYYDGDYEEEDLDDWDEEDLDETDEWDEELDEEEEEESEDLEEEELDDWDIDEFEDEEEDW